MGEERSDAGQLDHGRPGLQQPDGRSRLLKQEHKREAIQVPNARLSDHEAH